ncbi:MAG TPA: HAD family hydrolase [Burkholderiales bacterium]|nr:HAD family hydrolase [Burkholderiales bacterium]
MTQTKAVVFDVDGTLVDTNDLHVAAWCDTFRHYGREVAPDAVRAQMGKGGDQLMPEFWSEDELARIGEEMQQMRVDIFMRDYLPRAKPFPGVREFMEELRANGVRVVLASSAKKAELDHHVKLLGISPLIDGATSAEDAEHSKPCPDIFQAALERLPGVTPEEAIVVGDSPYDVIAAARAGMRTIGVEAGGFSRDCLLEAGAVAVYRDVAELRHAAWT